MNVKAVVYSVPLALAIACAALLSQSLPAHGQKPVDRRRWEYKIYRARVDDPVLATEQAEEAFNKFAAEGWEFASTLSSRSPNDIGTILFRRDAR